MVNHLATFFPGLRGSGYQITSPPCDDYNCIAWAASPTNTTIWWWPFGDPAKIYWPEAVPRAETVEAFRQLFSSLGFAECQLGEIEPGFEKVALFADTQGVPLHAARQLTGGRWTRKLGALQDIEHALQDLEGAEYGAVVWVMKRALPATIG